MSCTSVRSSSGIDGPVKSGHVVGGMMVGRLGGLEAEVLLIERTKEPRMFPLSKRATVGFLTKVVDASVMGLVTLCIYSASYLFAWGKAGSACIPKSKDPKAVSWVQVIIASLPFAIYPLALFGSGMVKAAEKDGHSLGPVATLCLIEFIACIILGCGMTVCMSGASGAVEASVGIVTLLLILVTVVIWGLIFKYPKCLRSFIWSTCFRQAEVAEEPDQPGAGGAAG